MRTETLLILAYVACAITYVTVGAITYSVMTERTLKRKRNKYILFAIFWPVTWILIVCKYIRDMPTKSIPINRRPVSSKNMFKN